MDSSLVVLRPWRLPFRGNADWDESKAEHAIWKTGDGVHSGLAVADQAAPGRSKAKVSRSEKQVLRCGGHVFIELLVYFLLAEWDDHRVDAESCVRVHAADSGGLCLIGDDEELPRLGIVCRRHWHRGFQDRDKHPTRDRLAGELVKRPTLRDESRCFLPHAISPSHW